MRRLAETMAILFLPAAALGCKDDGSGPEPAVLTTLEVAPADTGLFTAEPGASVRLVVTGRDQRGAVLHGVEFSFHSRNPLVATVLSDGLVTAASPGTVEIKVSATFEDVTLEGSSSVTVALAPATVTVTVTAPNFQFAPGLVDVRAGGTVSWRFEDVEHDVRFTSPGAPADIPPFSGSSVSREFPTSGTFSYWCSLHFSPYNSAGLVVVH